MKYVVYAQADGAATCEIDLTEEELSGIKKLQEALANEAVDPQFGYSEYSPRIDVVGIVYPTPHSKEENIEFRKQWDARYDGITGT